MSIHSSGQITTWQRKSADLLQQPPKSLITSYAAWKEAHSASKADTLPTFYALQDRDAQNAYRKSLRNVQQDNWERITDARPPMITKSDQGWVMHCSLNYENGFGIKKQHGWRRLVWAQSGGAWRIIEDVPTHISEPIV
jgi:hypothetical protein